MDYERLLKNLNDRRFLAALYPNAAEAAEAVLKIVGDQSCGMGGSKTVRDMGLYEKLTARGNRVFSHTFAPPAEKQQTRQAAMGAEVYLCSTNALTLDGRLINIDGTGNRVAGMLFGPPTVVVVAGKNKIAADYEAPSSASAGNAAQTTRGGSGSIRPARLRAFAPIARVPRACAT